MQEPQQNMIERQSLNRPVQPESGMQKLTCVKQKERLRRLIASPVISSKIMRCNHCTAKECK